MGSLREAAYILVLTYELRWSRKRGGTLGCCSLYLNDRAVLRVHPQDSIDEIVGLALWGQSHNQAVSSVQPLGSAGLQCHLIICGGDPCPLPDAGLIEEFLIVQNRAQYVLSNDARAGLRDDGVTLARILLVGSDYRHFCYRMNFVIAPVNGIVFVHRVSLDILRSGFDRSVHLLNHGCRGDLLSRRRHRSQKRKDRGTH